MAFNRRGSYILHVVCDNDNEDADVNDYKQNGI